MGKRKPKKPGLNLDFKDGEIITLDLPNGDVGTIYFEDIREVQGRHRKARFLFPSDVKILARNAYTPIDNAQ